MHANWVKQAVSSGGTGNLTLGSADSGYIDLNTAVGQGPRFSYTIEDGTSREAGIGYLSASTTLVRQVVLETLVSGTYDNTSPSALDVSTSAKVMIASDANGVQGAGNGIPGYPSQSGYVFDALSGASTSTHSISANWVSAFSFFLPIQGTFSGMAVNVTTAGAGSLIAGLYESGGDNTIKKITQIASAFDVSTTGTKTASFAANVKLNPGWYHVVCNSNISVSLRSDTGCRGLATQGIGDGSAYVCQQNALTYAASMASSFDLSASGWNNATNTKPRLALLRV